MSNCPCQMKASSTYSVVTAKYWCGETQQIMDPQTASIVEHGAENVKVWNYMTSNCVQNFALGKFEYKRILDQNVNGSHEKFGLGNNFHFEDDNDGRILRNCQAIECMKNTSHFKDPTSELWITFSQEDVR